MPKTNKIVINTGPTLALIAGIGNLSILQSMYEEVVVPYEVCEELFTPQSSATPNPQPLKPNP